MILAIIMGGYLVNNDNEKTIQEEEIKKKAEEYTVKYLKEKHNLDVTITGSRFAPANFQTVFVSGYVTNDKNKTFSVDVEYANNYHISSISSSWDISDNK
ncbi:DUF1433 domain-containing protein [Bacillus sp. DX1.1]|uniref:DUF1433 domain-containing protein n=1 Tax=unclassified Bacillus (in: firmicutes) TaxID=185979 RepID=UPI0025702A20|nr:MULTISPECIES: DUF1433 domain-containing protein [unclassified Bacillus (in: firmicutes)]MDM5153657.1 DUF1433 domain-containing protein [Bacillus sp. DX1.1]WJE84003.1 DUF1433 domain-containing protein [Bacillus sp. DX3.1]